MPLDLQRHQRQGVAGDEPESKLMWIQYINQRLLSNRGEGGGKSILGSKTISNIFIWFVIYWNFPESDGKCHGQTELTNKITHSST